MGDGVDEDLLASVEPHYRTISSIRELQMTVVAANLVSPRRRLSQCLEEDENDEHASSSDHQDRGRDKAALCSMSPRVRRHLDKDFFDKSLVAMKKEGAKSVTSSMEDVWIRRHDTSKDVDSQSWTDGSTMSSTNTSRSSNSDTSSTSSQYRSDATWGGVNPGRQMVALVTGRRAKSGGRHSVYHTVTGAVGGGGGTARVQQTHIPSIFEVFRPRSKSDTNQIKKPPGSGSTGIMGHMRHAIQGKDKSGGGASGDGSEGSGSVNASGGSSRGPVAKVIHLFRNRSQSAASADEKKKARAAVIHQQQIAGVIRRSSLDKRRLSLGTTGSGGHRGSDPSLDPNHAAILFRDSRGLPVADPFIEKINLSDLEEDESQIYVKFFRFHKCYDLIPTSAKLVVFDTQLLVKKAFFALVYNGVRAAPLWDSVKFRFVGMLTITDFIKILKMYYGTSTAEATLDEMEGHKLETWREKLGGEVIELVSIGPDASLYEAVVTLIDNRIHRLPVIDPETNNVLYILTHKRILRFLFLYINDLPKPSYLNKTLSELRVGTFNNIETAKEETTIISALDMFLDRRVSALPIVDDDGKLIDIYAKFDVINLAAEKTYDNLDVSLKQANEHRNEWFEGVHKCSMDDTLYTIIERIVRAEVHRLVVVDDEERVIGVVSLSDILEYLVLKPSREESVSRCDSPSIESVVQQEDTIEETREDEPEDNSWRIPVVDDVVEEEEAPESNWSSGLRPELTVTTIQ